MESSAKSSSKNIMDDSYSYSVSLSSRIDTPLSGTFVINPLYLPKFNKMIPNPNIPPPIVNPFYSVPKINDFISKPSLKAKDENFLSYNTFKQANKFTPKTNFEIDPYLRSSSESFQESDSQIFDEPPKNSNNHQQPPEISAISERNTNEISEPPSEPKHQIKDIKKSLKNSNRIFPYCPESHLNLEGKINDEFILARKSENFKSDHKNTFHSISYSINSVYKNRFIEEFYDFRYHRGLGCLLCCCKKSDLYILKKLKYQDASKEKNELIKFIKANYKHVPVESIAKSSIVDLFVICSLLENEILIDKINKIKDLIEIVEDTTNSCIEKFTERSENVVKDFFEKSYNALFDIITQVS